MNNGNSTYFRFSTTIMRAWSWELILKMCPQWDCWQYEVWVESWGNLCISTAIANHSGSPWLVLSMNNALDLLVGWNPFHQSCKSFILESNENDHLSRYPTYIYWICYNIASDVYVLSSRHVVEYLRYKLGIEPTPPSLEVEVLTAGPPEKSLLHILNATAFCNGGNGIPRTWGLVFWLEELGEL